MKFDEFNPDKNFCYTPTLKRDMQYLISGIGAFRAVAAKDKYWGRNENIEIFFMSGTNEQQEFVKRVQAEIFDLISLTPKYVSKAQDSDIRIAFTSGAGSWSYVGTDALFISKSQPTMNFGWLDRAVVLHETLHALGYHHEHQNPSEPIQWNRDKVIADLSGPPNNWTVEMIEHNVLNALDPARVDATHFDERSVMLYFFPDDWVLSGPGAGNRNSEMSQTDIDFLISKYGEEEPETPGVVLTVKDIFLRERDVSCLREQDIVRLLNMVGIDASMDDKKRDSAAILWDYIQSL